MPSVILKQKPSSEKLNKIWRSNPDFDVVFYFSGSRYTDELKSRFDGDNLTTQKLFSISYNNDSFVGFRLTEIHIPTPNGGFDTQSEEFS
jgi:hypothetical protein